MPVLRFLRPGQVRAPAPVGAPAEEAPAGYLSGRGAAVFLAILGVACGPAFFAPEVVGRVTALHPLADGPNPYFIPQHALLLYAAAPLVVAGSFALFLAPGALAVLLRGRTPSLPRFLVLAFGASLLLSIALDLAAKATLGTPLPRATLPVLWGAASLAAAAALLARIARGARIASPFADPAAGRRLASIGVAAFAGVALLLPKLFWETFNLDGVEAFEFGRSLQHHLLPTWFIRDGVPGFYHNFFLFAYPNHWFIDLFGEVEAAARSPFLLYLVLLFPAVLALVELGNPRRMSISGEMLVWLGLALYAVVQAYSTNYEPFFADLSETAATDTLWVLCFLGAVLALWTGSAAWFAAFGLMTYTASPGGLLLLGALGFMTVVVPAPDRGRQLRALAAALGACVLAGLLYELAYAPAVIGEASSQFSSRNLARRLFPPTLTEFVRLNALVFTTGILPAVSLGFAQRSEPRTFVLTGVAVLYFGVIYIQAWTSLHQFTPAMVLPLIVFWRLYLAAGARVQACLRPAIAIATAACLVLSLPRHFRIHTAARAFGQATEFAVGDYETDYAAMGRAAWTLSALLPDDYRMRYPDHPWGMDPYTWIYYASRPKPPDARINYVVTSGDPPPGVTVLERRDGVLVGVRDVRLWRLHREPPFPGIAASRLYEPILRRTYEFWREWSRERDRRRTE